MRIAIDGMLVKHGVSGVEHSIYGLAEALAASGKYDYRFFIPGNASLPSPGGPRFQTRRQALPFKNRLYRIFWEQTRLSRLAEAQACDLLHAPGYIAPLRIKMPVVLTVHDLIALKLPRYCRISNVVNYRLQLPLSIRKAAGIITPSECTRQEILCRFPEVAENRVRVIPAGVDARFFKKPSKDRLAQVRNRYKLPSSFILFVGQLEPKKNLPALIRAYTRFREQSNHSVNLLIAGNRGWKTKAIDIAHASSPFRDNIQFTGFVPDEDLPALMHAAAIFVFPSLYEGFGMPPVEAMACGVPVIASNSGALPEVLGDAAVAVNPQDEIALANAIEQIMADENLSEQLIGKGKKQARKYNWEGIARATESFYEEIISSQHLKEE